MLFLMLSLITDNKNLNLSDVKIMNNIERFEYMKCDYLYNYGNEENTSNLRRKVLTCSIEYIVGLGASVAGMGITMVKISEYNVEEAPYYFLFWHIFTEMTLTPFSIWTFGTIMKEEPSFIKTAIGVLLAEAIALGVPILFPDIVPATNYGYFCFIAWFVLIPPIGGVIGANLK